MKKKYPFLAFALVSFMAGQATAGVFNSDKVFDYLKAKSNEAYHGPQITFNGLKGYGVALPIYTIHNGKPKGHKDRIEYAYPSIGYGRLEGGKDRLQTTLLIDLIGLSNRMWKRALAGRVDVTKLPPVKFGPWIQYKDLNRLGEPWVIGDRTGLMAVYKFGSKPKE